MPYTSAIFLADLSTMSDRRDQLVRKFKCTIQTTSSLHNLLPPPRNYPSITRLRVPSKFPRIATRTNKIAWTSRIPPQHCKVVTMLHTQMDVQSCALLNPAYWRRRRDKKIPILPSSLPLSDFIIVVSLYLLCFFLQFFSAFGYYFQ